MHPVTHEPIPPSGPGFVGPADWLLLELEDGAVADDWLECVTDGCTGVYVCAWVVVVEGDPVGGGCPVCAGLWC